MRHYVLTRAVYGPGWPLDANRRRLELTAAVTAATMRAQTAHRWTWVVLLDPRDELLVQRQAVFNSAAPEARFVFWQGDGARDDVAFRAYRAPWREAFDPRHGLVLQTRLDDDDGLAPDALQRAQAAAPHAGGARAVLVAPRGIRVWDGRWSPAYRSRNAMQTLVTRDGDDALVYDHGHMKAHTVGRIHLLDGLYSWLWVRHQDTLSGWKQATHPLSPTLRSRFPVDWAYLEDIWQ